MGENNYHEIPKYFKIDAKDCIYTDVTLEGQMRIFEPIPNNKILYSNVLAVLNDILPISFLTLFNNGSYERNLLKSLNENNIKCIELINNLWIIYKNDIYLKQAMYILSLFSINPVDYEVIDHIQHLLEYDDSGINPYDYIYYSVLGYPKEYIRGIVLQKYILDQLNKKDAFENIDTIFFDADNFDDIIFNENKRLLDNGDIILFDAIFDYIAFECDKMLETLFSASCIFENFVKENTDKISNLPKLRPKIDVPIIKKVAINNLMEKKSVFRKSYNYYSLYNYAYPLPAQTYPVETTPKKSKGGILSRFRSSTPKYQPPYVRSYSNSTSIYGYP